MRDNATRSLSTCHSRTPLDDVNGARDLSAQAEHRLRRRKARHGAFAEAQEILRQVGGEFRRSDDRLAELRRDLLQPRREIDRRPDAGEIEPVAAADIAIQQLADVQRETEADRALAVA